MTFTPHTLLTPVALLQRALFIVLCLICALLLVGCQNGAVKDMLSSLPPDPGAAGRQTLAGIDADNDGVRDDVQRKIALQYTDKTALQQALRQYARAYQRVIMEGAAAGKETEKQVARAIACFAQRMNGDYMYSAEVAGFLKETMLNTAARRQAYEAYDSARAGGVYSVNKETEPCDDE